MEEFNAIPENVSVKGSFERDSLQLYSFEEFAQNIYEGIVYVPQNQENTTYKIYADNRSETVPEECAIAGDRSVNVTEHLILNPVCFAECLNCGEVNIKDINKESFTLFPNPGNSFVTVRLATPVFQTHISLYNIQNQKVREIEFSGTEYKIERGNLPAGFYILHVENSSLSVNQKIIFK
jgi:hypothetical protein